MRGVSYGSSARRDVAPNRGLPEKGEPGSIAGGRDATGLIVLDSESGGAKGRYPGEKTTLPPAGSGRGRKRFDGSRFAGIGATGRAADSWHRGKPRGALDQNSRQEPTMTDSSDDIWAAIAKERVAMLTTLADGRLVSRPMASRAAPDEGVIRFITRTDDKTHQIADDAAVNLAYLDSGRGIYLSVSGRATVNHDRAKLHALWGPWAQAWLPEGPDAPDVALIEVRPDDAALWDTTSSKIVATVKTLAAAVRGTQPDLGGVKHSSMD